ncbi:MAG: NAD(P)-dependent oxidoreductase [Elusimicrobia bacterium]|nr:NAD(P)-dependent oxidoreductase [Elusimicrobiota bacterium]
MTKETVLVTGACGFVGSHMVEHLLGKGYAVVASDHPRASLNGLKGRAPFVPIDLTKPETLEPLNQYSFQRVFHIAGLFDYTAPWQRLYEVNCLGTRNLLQALANNKSALKSVVVWSSGSVYGKSFRREPINENEPPQPINDYERSKLLGEQEALKFHQEQGLPVVVIRPAAIYGPRSRYGLAVPIFMIKKWLLRFIPGKGDFIGGYAHVDDIVGGAEFLSGRPEAVGQVFNISDDSNMSVGDSIMLTAKIMGAYMLPIHFPITPIKITAFIDQTVSRWLGRRPTLERDLIGYLDRDSWMDNTKLKGLGYQLKYPSLTKGLPEVIGWYKQQGWL